MLQPSTEIYTLSLHDALPISAEGPGFVVAVVGLFAVEVERTEVRPQIRVPQEGGQGRHLLLQRGKEADRKSTRLNSSHTVISYAVFCLKKKNKKYDKLYRYRI